jgi:hypothetical protein
MCKYCEKMEIMGSELFHDKSYLHMCLCPISFKGKGPYLYIKHDFPIDEHITHSYALPIFINYCPMCGRNLNESF